MPGRPVLTRGALIIVLLSGCQPDEPLRMVDPWLRSPLPGKTTSAGYFTLDNRTGGDLVLETVTSPHADRVELHTHDIEGDMMRMRRLDRLVIPAGSRIAFSPGGHHLMLFGLDPDIEAVRVTLGFADGTALSAAFDVRGLTPTKKDDK